MQPIDQEVYYGISGKSYLAPQEGQRDLIPPKLHALRWKLNQKAKQEPKFRFYSLYDRIYRKDVLEAAWKQVGKKGKAAGIDGVTAEAVLEEGLEPWLESIREELKAKSYRPSPVLRVYIPKANGKQRPLGIPTLKDRVVQMAVVLILEPIFEADFHDCSHGFRPGRNAHDALSDIREHLKSGRMEVYDADLKGYFDTIPHDKLLSCIRMRVVDRSVLGLIRRWLKAPIIEEDRKGRRQPPQRSERGTPQGGVISPLLANVYLHWFDTKFHRKGGPWHWANARLVRYADDFVVLARYQGEQLDQWIKHQLEDWLGLQLNGEKTKVVRLKRGEGLDFLGFTFRLDRDLQGRDRRYLNVIPSKKSTLRARDKVRELTGSPKCFRSTPEIVADLNQYLKGWKGYFRYGYPRKVFGHLNHYTRGRLSRHLNRRSQRKHRRASGQTHYQHCQMLGLVSL